MKAKISFRSVTAKCFGMYMLFYRVRTLAPNGLSRFRAAAEKAAAPLQIRPFVENRSLAMVAAAIVNQVPDDGVFDEKSSS